MLLQQRGDDEYLYIVRNSQKGFTVVDVTNARNPQVIRRVAWPNGASAGQLELVGGRVGIEESADDNAGTSPAPLRTKTISILDLSEPSNPKTVETFTGVTSVLTDPSRHLLYLTNSEGLWVVRQNQAAQTRPCGSSDAIASMPSCQ
jgi:hypothetical protein